MARSKDKRAKPDEVTPEKGKTVIIVGTVIILLAALGTLLVVVAGPADGKSTCQIIRQAMAKGQDYSKGHDVSEINECERDFDCPFDVLTCDIPCPLGFQTDKNRCVISCQCASSSMGTFQGDIQFDDTDVNGLLMRYGHASIQETFAIFSSSVRASVVLWPKAPDGRAKVAYVTDQSLEAEMSLFEEAFASYREKTCIDFIPRTQEKDYVTFVREVGCWSRVGRGGGPQPVSIADSCLTLGILLHEMMHVIGFEHEHVRPDRDAFIVINIPSIIKSKLINFAKIREPVKKLGRPYDYASVTHISSLAWKKDSYAYSFVKQNSEPIIGQRDELSTEDVKEINILYDCDVTVGGPSPGISVHGPNAAGGGSSGQHVMVQPGMPGDSYTLEFPLTDTSPPMNGASPSPPTGQTDVISESAGGALTTTAVAPVTGDSSATGGGSEVEGVLATGDASTTGDEAEPGHSTTGGAVSSGVVTGIGVGSAAVGASATVAGTAGRPSPSGVAWSEWVTWSNCMETCGRSEAIRFRRCVKGDGSSAYGCRGEWYQAKACDEDPCPEKIGMWEEWQPWQTCTRTCTLGYQWRKRKCPEGDNMCPGYGFGGKFCVRGPCPGAPQRDAKQETKRSGKQIFFNDLN